jgi:dienelactone hydrolase
LISSIHDLVCHPGPDPGSIVARFNNYTTPRYDSAAAKLAWERTIAFLKADLEAPAAAAAAAACPTAR